MQKLHCWPIAGHFLWALLYPHLPHLSYSEDDFSAVDSSSSSDLSELSNNALEELFPFDLPENMTWEKRWIDVNTEPFRLTPGPTVNLPDSGRAIDFFMLYFTEEIIGMRGRKEHKIGVQSLLPN